VLVAEQPLAVGQHTLEEVDGVVGAARLPVGGGEVRAGAQRGGVLVAEQVPGAQDAGVDDAGRAFRAARGGPVWLTVLS